MGALQVWLHGPRSVRLQQYSISEANMRRLPSFEQKVLDKLSALKGEERYVYAIGNGRLIFNSTTAEDRMDEAKSLLLRVLDGIRTNLGEALSIHAGHRERSRFNFLSARGTCKRQKSSSDKRSSPRRETHGIGNRFSTFGDHGQSGSDNPLSWKSC